jgi:hypothetical protein
MNYCFDNPCPNGFAFHKKYPGFQTAFSGSFRYVLYIQWSRGGNLGGVEQLSFDMSLRSASTKYSLPALTLRKICALQRTYEMYRFTRVTPSELRSHRITYQHNTFCTYGRHLYSNIAQIYLFLRVEKFTFLVKFLNFPQNVG